MASLIGLCIRAKLMQCLPARFKLDVQVWSYKWMLACVLHKPAHITMLRCAGFMA